MDNALAEKRKLACGSFLTMLQSLTDHLERDLLSTKVEKYEDKPYVQMLAALTATMITELAELADKSEIDNATLKDAVATWTARIAISALLRDRKSEG